MSGIGELLCDSKKEDFSHDLTDLRLIGNGIRSEVFVQSSIEISRFVDEAPQ